MRREEPGLRSRGVLVLVELEGDGEGRMATDSVTVAVLVPTGIRNRPALEAVVRREVREGPAVGVAGGKERALAVTAGRCEPEPRLGVRAPFSSSAGGRNGIESDRDEDEGADEDEDDDEDDEDHDDEDDDESNDEDDAEGKSDEKKLYERVSGIGRGATRAGSSSRRRWLSDTVSDGGVEGGVGIGDVCAGGGGVRGDAGAEIWVHARGCARGVLGERGAKTRCRVAGGGGGSSV
jgi:hypothetical protein